jgi:ribonuclease/clavin/mitogillin
LDSLRILNVGYRSVNCYLLITEKTKLLLDVGWPGGMQELKWIMSSNGLSVKDVTHVLITHYHIDHGAIAQEMKDKGAKLIVMETQREHLNTQKKFIKPPLVFHEIKKEDNIQVAFEKSRGFLKTLGIDGEIISTPSHSQDHVTLVLDEGIAFTGDLPLENCSAESDAGKDWQRLRIMNVRRICPAHGRTYNLPSYS